ncbi:SpoIID/LytB domain-containing protein [Calderihabitans maritimus]|uniref:Sporulation protein and related proteins-like n=1 Tax=Calderihabitans maritimus TaxID=1246530 RepID=A0A1Z5HTE4_9FIRM|nr:SpoIID/LytB domain-containing protein [Calderihabitans maritimus]GAW92708.1 sporulation protein and related proteins-like [Calderihabitans maritimus]
MERKKLVWLIGFLLISFFMSEFKVSAEEIVPIRVRLASGNDAVSFRVVEGKYELVDGALNLPIGSPLPGEIWTIRKEGLNLKVAVNGQLQEIPYEGPLFLTQKDTSQLNLFSYNDTRYRGDLVIYNTQNGLLVVNVLDIEKYLYGVVGREMGYWAEEEALKTQAIVSRTYALSRRNPDRLYDVGLDTFTQVYGGYEAELEPGADRVKKAVDATAGLVIYYDGQLIEAFFHANAGGYTESSENVWSEARPYLKAVPSPWDEYALKYPKQSSGWPANTYSWVKTFTRQELEEQLEQWNEQNQILGRDDRVVRVGKILALKTYRFAKDSRESNASGRVTRLDLIGNRGTKTFWRDTIRSVFGLKSTLFEVKFDSTVSILSGVGEQVEVHNGSSIFAIGAEENRLTPNGNRETYVVKGMESRRVIPKEFRNVTFVGRGHGHGVGLSQWGARGMAAAGHNYQEIIEHYYNQGKKDGRLTIGPYRLKTEGGEK